MECAIPVVQPGRLHGQRRRRYQESRNGRVEIAELSYDRRLVLPFGSPFDISTMVIAVRPSRCGVFCSDVCRYRPPLRMSTPKIRSRRGTTLSVPPAPVKGVGLSTSKTRDLPPCQSSSGAVKRSDPGIQWGADMKKLAICVGVGAAIWIAPRPSGVTLEAWRLLAIFVGTIVGIITTPVPLGAVAILGLGTAMLTKTLPFAAAFSAMSSEIPWLIAIAYFLAGGFQRSGLGQRMAYLIVRVFGKTTLGLTYSLVFSEALLAPAIPSVAARTGGIFVPLARALCEACGSDPADGTERKMGSYVMTTCFQTSCVTSAMFITAMAANPLIVNLAQAAINFQISWGAWAIAGLVPGLACLIGVPLLLYVLYPPQIKDTPDAPKQALKELERLGPMSTNEKITAAAFVLTVGLWIFGNQLGINSVAAAVCGWSILLITGVISWKECLNNNAAWDTLTWFAALVAMAAYLNKYGFIPWFSQKVVELIGGLGLSWQTAFMCVCLIYFYTHYFFASGAAHVGAMYTAFLSVCGACGVPLQMAALALGQLSDLMGCLTTYGIGSAPPFFATGYVPQSDWLKYGFIMSVFYLVVWLVLGGAWWKILGLY